MFANQACWAPGVRQKGRTGKKKPAKSAGFVVVGAEDEGRTRDLLLGKEALYH